MKLRGKILQKGFAVFELFIILVVITGVVGVGYYVAKVRNGGILTSKAEVNKASEAKKLASSNTNAQKAESAARNYTFDVKKDSKTVLDSTISGQVAVGIHMNVDNDLTNVRFYVDGIERGKRDKIVKTGYREFYDWQTKDETNGKHKLSVKAVNKSGKEFQVYNAQTDTQEIEVTVDNGAKSRAGTSNNNAGGSSTGGSSSPNDNSSGSSSESAAEVTAKPKLTVSPGPLDGLAGSKSGTVDGENVSGGIVFKVKFKRPKTEIYDLRSMHVDISKDGKPRITMWNNGNSIDVREEGDFKIYTFKRYYPTQNKPNGRSTWQAKFIPNVSTPAADTLSDAVTLNINNSDSTAEDTCRSLKNEVNSLFDTMTTRIDKVQGDIVTVNASIDRRYVALNLAATNPIPNYDSKKSQNAQKSAEIDSKQTELEALKLKCAGGVSVEDAGAQVMAFKTKLEEVKSAISVYRASTLDLLGELRSRLPQDNNGGGNSNGGGSLPGASPTKVACVGGLTDGARVQVVYAHYASDNKNMDSPTTVAGHNYSSTRDFIKRSTARMNREVIESAQRQNGFLQLRFATDSNCEVAIQDLTLTGPKKSELGSFTSDLVNNPQSRLFDLSKKYLVFADYESSNLSVITCGLGGAVFNNAAQHNANKENPDPAVNSFNNTSSGIAVFPRTSRSSLHGVTADCWGPSISFGNNKPSDVQLHELMHSFGAVLASAPHHSAVGHCTDLQDNMCYKDAPSVTLTFNNCTAARASFLLDCKADDYFNLNPTPGSYLATHWNIAKSKWFTSER